MEVITSKTTLLNLYLLALTASILFPILLLSRQWLSWIYIYKRLNSENIEYEESGWYDGQSWEKPIDWRAKDLLIAQHQIKPILNHIELIIIVLLSVIISKFLSLNLEFKNASIDISIFFDFEILESIRKLFILYSSFIFLKFFVSIA